MSGMPRVSRGVRIPVHCHFLANPPFRYNQYPPLATQKLHYIVLCPIIEGFPVNPTLIK